MNQILVTEKIYVTPELKRKKKIYKILFIISVFCMICLTSVYVYAEYDRNKESDISSNILQNMFSDKTLISEDENALIVKITQDIANNIDEYQATEDEEQVETPEQPTPDSVSDSTSNSVSTYTASNGKQYEYVGRVVIPKINVDYPILANWSDALLKVSICKFHGPNPNEVGNLCLVGHNYRNKRFFSKVPTLEIGDIVQITDLSKRTIEYEVYDMHTVLPDNKDDTTQKTGGKKEVTLITCTNDSQQRVIVKCKEKK